MKTHRIDWIEKEMVRVDMCGEQRVDFIIDIYAPRVCPGCGKMVGLKMNISVEVIPEKSQS